MARKTPRVLSDTDWQRIAPHLPPTPASPQGGRPRADDRECFEGILWRLRSGARWKDIPVDMPSGSTCWRRLQAWAGEGVLAEVHAVLVRELAHLGKLDLSVLFADATFIRGKKGATTSATPRSARG